MQNSLPFLKRKLKNFSTINKVGSVNLTRSLTALSEVQKQRSSIDEQLEKTNDALSKSALYYQANSDVLIPELMGNQSLYVNELVQERQVQQQKRDNLDKDVDEKLTEVFKLKKTNEVVQQKMQLAQQQMLELYHKKMDEEIADVLQNTQGGQD